MWAELTSRCQDASSRSIEPRLHTMEIRAAELSVGSVGRRVLSWQSWSVCWHGNTHRHTHTKSGSVPSCDRECACAVQGCVDWQKMWDSLTPLDPSWVSCSTVHWRLVRPPAKIKEHVSCVRKTERLSKRTDSPPPRCMAAKTVQGNTRTYICKTSNTPKGLPLMSSQDALPHESQGIII